MLTEKLKNIIVIGVGGTGSHLVPTLARHLNSLPHKNEVVLVFCDGDKYEHNNLERQEFAHSRLGKNKAAVQAEMFGIKYGDLNIEAVEDYLGEENVANVITEDSIVFCCVDNHFCRALVSRHCQNLDNVLLISGGNEAYDGNVQSFIRLDGKSLNDPIEVRHPELVSTNDGDRSEMSCEELSNLPGGTQYLVTNATAANIMLQLFYSYEIGQPNVHEIKDIYFDIRNVGQRVVK